jgi:hypothetical protein
MNLLTLIGAAVGSQAICEQLFKNPLEAARSLGLVLTETDVCALQELFNPQNQNELCEHFREIRTFICKRPPCPYAVAVPGDDVSCDQTREDTAA